MLKKLNHYFQSEFDVPDEVIDQFIEKNRLVWKKTEHNGKYIFLNLMMVRNQIGWILPKLLFAKGLEEKTHCKVVVLTWQKNDKIGKIIEAFEMEYVGINEDLLKHGFMGIRAFGKATSMMIRNLSGEELKKVKVFGITAGKSIYEDILRTSELSTLRYVRNQVAYRKILRLLWMTYYMNRLMEKKPIQYFIADDICYHEGILVKLANRHGAKLMQCDNDKFNRVYIKENGDITSISDINHDYVSHYINQIDDAHASEWVEKYLEDRFQGLNGRIIDRKAFSGNEMELDEIVKLIQLDDTSKKNILIMAHTFSDAVFNYGDIYFRDYYDWLEKTLQEAKKCPEVNWILKAHPSRRLYHETQESIEALYEKYKCDHIKMLPDSVGAESVKNFADCIVTIGGTAGSEFTCFGVPCIIAGKPFYHGFGYTIEPKTQTEYLKLLHHLNSIEALTDEQILMARKAFYAIRNREDKKYVNTFSDEFANLVNEEYGKMFAEITDEYFESDQGTGAYNVTIINRIMKYMDGHDMTATEYYQTGLTKVNQ